MICERIKQRRKELELSVEEVAAKLGKNRATIYRYESDYILSLPITVLEPLAQVLETTPDYLMGWKSKSLGTAIKQLTPEEKLILQAYQEHPELQHSIKVLLGLESI